MWYGKLGLKSIEIPAAEIPITREIPCSIETKGHIVAPAMNGEIPGQDLSFFIYFKFIWNKQAESRWFNCD